MTYTLQHVDGDLLYEVQNMSHGNVKWNGICAVLVTQPSHQPNIFSQKNNQENKICHSFCLQWYADLLNIPPPSHSKHMQAIIIQFQVS